MTLRELNQLWNLQREIQLLNQLVAKYDAVLYPEAARRRKKAQIPPEEVTRRIETAKRRAEEKRTQYIAEAERLEAYIDSVDNSLVRMAMRLRFADGLSWTAVAVRIGGGNTENSVKKMVYRHIRRSSEGCGESCPDA